VIRWLWHGPALILSSMLVSLVRGYQRFLSPMLPKACRYEPSCSEYFILAVRKYGAIKGAMKGIWRICRCNPWGGHGEDYP
jgi:uncharacterized protein